MDTKHTAPGATPAASAARGAVEFRTCAAEEIARFETARALAAAQAALAVNPGDAAAHGMRALALLQGRRTADTGRAAGRALALVPAQPEALLALSGAALAEGRVEQAAAAALMTLAAAPGSAEGWARRAMILKAQHRDGAALAALDRALALNPRSAAVQVTAAGLWRATGRPRAAEDALEAAARAAPSFSDAHAALARMRAERGELTKAAAACRAALVAAPAHTAALNLQAECTLRLGKAETAEAAARRAVALDPARREARLHLATAMLRLGLLEQAEAMADALTAAYPDWPAALRLQAEVFLRSGRAAAAAAAALAAARQAPDWADALVLLAEALVRGGRPDEAGHYARRLLALHPDQADLHWLVAEILVKRGRAAAALAARRTSLRLDPAQPDRWVVVATQLADRGDTQAAHASMTEALTRDPRPEWRLMKALMLPVVAADRAEITAARAALAEAVATLRRERVTLRDPLTQVGRTAFYLAYHGENDRPLQQALAALYAEATPSLTWTAPHCRDLRPDAPHSPDRRVRLGVLSEFLNSHTIGKLNLGLLERIDRARFELHVIRPEGPGDPMAEAIDAAADRVLSVPRDLDAARRAIAALRLDALYYPDVGMAPFSYFLAFARLAPVQAVSWGHPVTTGVPNLDGFLSAWSLEPPGAEEHYSERLVRFRNLPTRYRRPEPADLVPDRGRFGLPAGAHLYVCPQSLFKFHPDFDSVLGAILRADPAGLLILIEGRHGEWSRRLRDRLAAAFPGESARVVFLPAMGEDDFLTLLVSADALLDPPNFGGGNTTYEAFAVGAPIVTLPGPFMRGRVTAACYETMGIMDLVAGDTAQYVDLAVRLGGDRAFRAAIGQRIAQRATVLYGDGAVREFEDFFADPCQLEK